MGFMDDSVEDGTDGGHGLVLPVAVLGGPGLPDDLDLILPGVWQ